MTPDRCIISRELIDCVVSRDGDENCGWRVAVLHVIARDENSLWRRCDATIANLRHFYVFTCDHSRLVLGNSPILKFAESCRLEASRVEWIIYLLWVLFDSGAFFIFMCGPIQSMIASHSYFYDSAANKKKKKLYNLAASDKIAQRLILVLFHSK